MFWRHLAPSFSLLLGIGSALATDVPDEAPDPLDVPDDGMQSILRGAEADEDDFPMAGAFVIEGTRGGASAIRVLTCSSSLIAPDVILTAGHCVDPRYLAYAFDDPESLDIRWTRTADLGEFSGSEQLLDWPDDTVAVREVVIHPGFDEDFDVGLAHNDDIALAFLEQRVTGVPLAWLPTPDQAELLETGRDVWIVGWGQQSEGAGLGISGVKRMALGFINVVGEWEVQIGAGQDDARICFGDSGGPSFIDVSADGWGDLRQVGIASHTFGFDQCAEGGVETIVAPYLDWLDEQMRAGCADQTRVWCVRPGLPGTWGERYLPPEWEGADPDGPDPDDDDDIDDDDAGGGPTSGRTGDPRRRSRGCDLIAASPTGWFVLLLITIRRRSLSSCRLIGTPRFSAPPRTSRADVPAGSRWRFSRSTETPPIAEPARGCAAQALE
jgi:hypothetical protein